MSVIHQIYEPVATTSTIILKSNLKLSPQCSHLSDTNDNTFNNPLIKFYELIDFLKSSKFYERAYVNKLSLQLHECIRKYPNFQKKNLRSV